MKKYFIILMTLKLIDLFETKFIGEQKEDAVKEFKKRLGKLDKGEIIKLEVLRVKTRLFFAFPK